MPTTGELLAALESARRERDEALQRLAEARVELDALRLTLKQKNEPEPALYPDDTALGVEPPLRYVAADAVNDALKRFTAPLQRVLRDKLGERHGR